MKLIRNIGADRVIDMLRPQLTAGRRCNVVTSAISLFAFSEVLARAGRVGAMPPFVLLPAGSDLALLGADADRAARNRLQTRWLASRLRDALQECARLDGEIARLRATAAKEKQMSRRVELNLELKCVEAAQAATRAKL